jgi:molecular chaperone GrpE
VTQAEGHEKPVIRDRRRIDPETGKLRTTSEAAAPQQAASTPDEAAAQQRAAASEAAGAAQEDGSGQDTTSSTPTAPGADEGAATPDAAALAATIERLERELVERTTDLKRVQAEYLNYKRRVERDRELVRDLAVGSVLTELLPVLDDIGRAREHGELTGGFKAVAEALETTVAKLGLVRYGEVGDSFDPRIHEALMHSYADGVDGPTCTAILQPGYRHGDRVLRPARVAVSEPTVGPHDNGADQRSGEAADRGDAAGQQASDPAGQQASDSAGQQASDSAGQQASDSAGQQSETSGTDSAATSQSPSSDS